MKREQGEGVAGVSRCERQEELHRLLSQLRKAGNGELRNIGTSMEPVIRDGAMLGYQACAAYQTGDIVFCRLEGGTLIDAHWIAAQSPDGRCLIASNTGKVNGWAIQVFARVVTVDGAALDAPKPPLVQVQHFVSSGEEGESWN